MKIIIARIILIIFPIIGMLNIVNTVTETLVALEDEFTQDYKTPADIDYSSLTVTTTG